MVATGSLLYGDFGSSGIWMYNGSSWSQLTPGNPENIAASGSMNEPQGTWEAPYRIDLTSGPAFVTGDTTSVTTSKAQYYSPCMPTANEGGPEIVYTVVAPTAGTLSLSLSYTSGAVDVDVHLLSAPSANNCVARGNTGLNYQVTGGTQYWIVVDTFCISGNCLSGPFGLTISLTP